MISLTQLLLLMMNAAVVMSTATSPSVGIPELVEKKFSDASMGRGRSLSKDIVGHLQCKGGLTVYIVCDGSQSIGEANFDKVKATLKIFATESVRRDIELGIVVFSDDTYVITASNDLTYLTMRIDNIKYPNGGSYTNLGIAKASYLLMASGSTTPKAIVVVTDGTSNNATLTIQEAIDAKNLDVTIVAVGVTGRYWFSQKHKDVFLDELKDMASGDEMVYDIPSFDSLTPSATTVIDRLCKQMIFISRPLQTSTISLEKSDAILSLDLSRPEVTDGVWAREMPIPGKIDVEDGGKYEIDTTAYTQSLTIKDLQFSDGGLYSYTFRGMNVIGYLIVIGHLQNVSCETNHSAVFSVKKTKFGDVRSFWFKDKKRLGDEDVKYHITSDGEHQRLEVDSVQLDDEGVYEYSVGGMSTSAFLNVWECSGAYTLYIVCDGSESMGENNFRKLKEVLKITVREVIERNNDNRVGVIVYSDFVTGLIPASNNLPRLENKIGDLDYPKGRTHTDAGMRRAITLLGEVKTPKVMLVIGHGISSDEAATEETAAEARSKGITSIVIGITEGIARSEDVLGRYSLELQTIATEKRMVTIVQSTDQLQRTIPRFANQLCKYLVFVTSSLDNIITVENEEVRFSLKLNTRNTTSGLWTKDTPNVFEIPVQGSSRYEVVTDGFIQYLRIKNVRYSDAGIYRYTVRGISTSAILTVIERPQNISTQVNRRVQFSVRLSEHSEGVYGGWFRGTVRVKNKPGRYTVSSEDNFRLVFEKVQTEDAGSYVFRVGDKSTSASLIVFDDTVVKSLTTTVALEDTDVPLRLRLNHANVTVGVWKKESPEKTTITKDDESKFVSESVGFEQILVIKDVQYEDAGVYSYSVRGVKTSANVIVVERLRNVYSQTSKRAQFHLRMTEDKSVTGVWTKNSEPLVDMPGKYSITKTAEHHRLTVEDVQSSDQALYIFKVGDVSTSADLIISEISGTHLCNDATKRYSVGYQIHPTDCDKYLQCFFTPNGHVIGAIRKCPFGYKWNQKLLRCQEGDKYKCPTEHCSRTDLSFKYEGSCRSYWKCGKHGMEAFCCPQGMSFRPGHGCQVDLYCQDLCPTTSYLRQAPCDLQPDWSRPDKYKFAFGLFGAFDLYCPHGSRFDLLDCGCSEDTSDTCEASHVVSFSKRTLPTWVTDLNKVDLSGGKANFVEQSYLFLDIRRDTTWSPLALRIRFKESEEVSGTRTLASSSSCNQFLHRNSLLIQLMDDVVRIEVSSSAGSLTQLLLPTRGMARHTPKTLTLAYREKYLTALLEGNGIKYANDVIAAGVILLRCGLRIGTDVYSSTPSFFDGSIEEISVYPCSPLDLYKDG